MNAKLEAELRSSAIDLRRHEQLRDQAQLDLAALRKDHPDLTVEEHRERSAALTELRPLVAGELNQLQLAREETLVRNGRLGARPFAFFHSSMMPIAALVVLLGVAIGLAYRHQLSLAIMAFVLGIVLGGYSIRRFSASLAREPSGDKRQAASSMPTASADDARSAIWPNGSAVDRCRASSASRRCVVNSIKTNRFSCNPGSQRAAGRTWPTRCRRRHKKDTKASAQLAGRAACRYCHRTRNSASGWAGHRAVSSPPSMPWKKARDESAARERVAVRIGELSTHRLPNSLR